MPLKVWDGAAWTTANRLKVWDGASWVDSKYGKVWNGSSWVEFFNGYSATLIANTYTRLASPSSLQINSDGYVYAANGGVQQFIQQYQWRTGIAPSSDYEVKADFVAGNTPGGSSLGTWISLGSNAQWNITAIAGQFRYFEVNVSIRVAATAVVLAGPVGIIVECDRT